MLSWQTALCTPREDYVSHRLLRDRRIMIVEDEFLIALDLSQSLAHAGAVVVGPYATVALAKAALDSDAALDGAVLDINLSGELVYPLAEILMGRQIPFVFTTGYDSRCVPEEFQSVPRCEKPTQLGTIIELVARQVAARASSVGLSVLSQPPRPIL